ncbi:MAG: UDP-N-acetylmuramoyl-tripeptide--D-alanyl-D-alanine ligase [Candidatus Omnitrophica bacterium]|nr:UDP-N-acetylmuramoyl-tripeptide--D-alanyl-D-alanine ligase [Candidatus Omnitrophota bacterium]MDD5429386.1 UDP-N-acetylmuramoyl-tripeptide--D-alanyl-D-alanine ligase [Candidatus Omnitrophota bacterium]
MLFSKLTTLKHLLEPEKIHNPNKFKPFNTFSIDSRSIKKGQGFIAIKGKHKDGHDFIEEALKNGACCIVAQKEPVFLPKKAVFIKLSDSLAAMRILAGYIRKEKKVFVYAVTGSLGKTTTKEMLAFLLEPEGKVLKNERTENNVLGVAKTIFSLNNEKVMILELGTNHPGEIEDLSRICFPDVGIITFIRPVHLEGLKNTKGILSEKLSLLKVNPRMKVVLNRDEPCLSKVSETVLRQRKFPADTDFRKIYWFGKGKNNDLFFSKIEVKGENVIFLIQNEYCISLPFWRQEFIYNIAAAVLAARLRGESIKKLLESISGFDNFPPMRMDMKRVKGLWILNDAYNANPYSFKKSLEVLKTAPFKKIAVIGDMLELGVRSSFYHKGLAAFIVKNEIDYCFLLGKYALQLKDVLLQLGYNNVICCDSHSKAASGIWKVIKEKGFDSKRCLIFLKGSRKMELEKVIGYL